MASAEWRSRNRDRIREHNRRYRESHPEMAHHWEKHHLERARIAAYKWKAGKERWERRYPEKAKAIGQRRHQRDRLRSNMSRRMRLALRGQRKPASTEALVGCTLAFLRAHLESLFREGMTWDNYGFQGWHIDHIRPCASFDLTDPEQQRACFHWTNLQPLWAKDNISKGARIAA